MLLSLARNTNRCARGGRQEEPTDVSDVNQISHCSHLPVEENVYLDIINLILN